MTLFNPFVLKKYTALMLAGSFTTIIFFILANSFGIWLGIAGFIIGLILSILVGTHLLKNPFTAMLEGKGLICFDMNSTGILQPFLIGINSPYMQGTYRGQKIKDIFDRAAVFQLAPPIDKKENILTDTKEGKLKIELDRNEFNAARFALNHYPVLIWNDNIKSLITKDFFSNRERDAFAEHGVLYLNKQVEELNNHLLNFGRYIVENLKPKVEWLKSKWAILIFVVALIIMIIIFAPSIMEALGGVTKPATTALGKSGAASGAISLP